MKKSTHAGQAQKKKYSTWAGQEEPRISLYATCLLPFLKNDLQNRRNRCNCFFCAVWSVVGYRCRWKCCSCLEEHKGNQGALNVSMCQLRSPFTSDVYFLLSALALKQRTSCGCTEMTCTHTITFNTKGQKARNSAKGIGWKLSNIVPGLEQVLSNCHRRS